ATVLVNPRQACQDFTRYSFPIKTADYMLAGKPVIGYRLEAIPSEYDNHIIYVNSDTIDALSCKIMKVCELDLSTRQQIGNQNREFILTKKNAKVQSAKILDMMRRFAYKKKNNLS
ncbi:MAG TPA: glycosyltransferase family 4 protein, partial [Spirochaetales bacterium]|nr:glycosyltransferase family 4 protein [Spirochaetales bacterium]